MGKFRVDTTDFKTDYKEKNYKKYQIVFRKYRKMIHPKTTDDSPHLGSVTKLGNLISTLLSFGDSKNAYIRKNEGVKTF